VLSSLLRVDAPELAARLADPAVIAATRDRTARALAAAAADTNASALED